jgi:spore coat protein U-like protein
MRKILTVLAITGFVLGGSGMAMAADTTTFGVSASVEEACVVGTTGDMSFGSLALLDATSGKVVTSGNNDATATFYQACTTGTTGVEFAFDGTALTGFAMEGAGDTPDTIAYTLFADSSRADGLTKATAKASSAFSGFAADGADHQLTVYGRIDLASMVAKKVDSYSDTVTVTVSY